MKLPSSSGELGIWFAERGFIPEAVHYLLLAGDFEQAASLIEDVRPGSHLGWAFDHAEPVAGCAAARSFSPAGPGCVFSRH